MKQEDGAKSFRSRPYAVVAWLLVQVVVAIEEPLRLPGIAGAGRHVVFAGIDDGSRQLYVRSPLPGFAACGGALASPKLERFASPIRRNRQLLGYSANHGSRGTDPGR